MKSTKRLITTESVSYGHPDKIADQISDAILDAYISNDKFSKVAVETMIKDNVVVLGGEVTSNAVVNIDNVVKGVIEKIPFSEEHNLLPEKINIINLIGKQSQEISSAVFKHDGEIGAGDQGMMLGYACNETPNYMPLGMYLAKTIINGVVAFSPNVGPDMKTQVTIEENLDNNKKRVNAILVSTMHSKELEINQLREQLKEYILSNKCAIDENIFKLIDKDTNIFINPAGAWHLGGPVSDCGITGRKIAVDQYGSYCPVGGGAFSGKDCTKSDRSASYLARYIAKNIVASGIYNECIVELAYMIGCPQPVSLRIDGKGNNDVDNDKLVKIVQEIFPMTPSQIIEKFDMRKPIYYNLALHGHFGTVANWEVLDKIQILRQMIGM
jgi:S-adenosylmethionine synthetase